MRSFRRTSVFCIPPSSWESATDSGLGTCIRLHFGTTAIDYALATYTIEDPSHLLEDHVGKQILHAKWSLIDFLYGQTDSRVADEVLIEVKKTGICGSDIHFYVDGKLGDKIVTEPIVLGHESSGVIVKAGANVETLRIGERVAIEPWPMCRMCDHCKSGAYQLCLQTASPRRGTLARYYKVPTDLAYRLPDNLSLEDGAMIEPLAVAVHAVNSIGNMRAGQNVAIFGCGTIGLLCMAVARALGAARIIAVDINSSRLEFAKNYAATDAFSPSPFHPDESKMAYSERTSMLFKRALGKEKGNAGVDLAIDATGAETCIQMAFFVAKAGGTYVHVGIGVTEAKVPITTLLTKELTLKGSSRYGPGDYPLAIALAASGKIDLKPLVTHRFEFDDAITAFETTRVGMGADGKHVLKTMISGVNNSYE